MSACTSPLTVMVPGGGVKAGGPTETLERMVESKEMSAHLAASLRLVSR